MAFTALFVLIDAALLFVYLGAAQDSENLTKVGGYFVLSPSSSPTCTSTR